MRIVMLGAGAVGCFFGGHLAASGADVSFLVRARRAEQLRRTGVRICSPLGDVQTAVTAVVDASSALTPRSTPTRSGRQRKAGVRHSVLCSHTSLTPPAYAGGVTSNVRLHIQTFLARAYPIGYNAACFWFSRLKSS
jgi:2-polyprenyl-6-methoxyphenol hydroxylase-like FAD-dependent oxidoreductase